MGNKVSFFECRCHDEGLVIEKWVEDWDHKNEVGHLTEFWFSFWQKGFYNKTKMTLGKKLRWIKQIWFKGVPWQDMVLLDIDNAKSLRDYLIENLKDE